MSTDRQLIERIKERFTRKSSTQLRQILQTHGGARWSAEAIAAADEVLSDRASGHAYEPANGEEEPPLADTGHDVNSIALIAGLNILTFPLGWMVLPVNRPIRDDPIARDQPVPFGPEIAWLAVNTANTEGVATALGLSEFREAAWSEGVEAAYMSSVFVTPPVGEWTLVVSRTLFPPRQASEVVKPLLEHLSQAFGEAQYFCTHQGAGLHTWARASGGRLVRGYCWLAEEGLTLWNEGPSTLEESDLGLGFDGSQASTSEERPPAEGDVLELASYWSVDPSALDENFKEPVLGLLGKGGWVIRQSTDVLSE